MRTCALATTLCAVLWFSASCAAGESRGHLVIIGGGLRPDNADVFERLVRHAGGAAQARFVVLPTASRSQASASNFRDLLTNYGIPLDRCEILDVNVDNAVHATADPRILEQVRRSTGLFMTGGDQNRIMGALLKQDGGETPLLAEMRALLARGGVMAGSSAGAAVQSEWMLSVSGLPNEALDEGLDALDFGLTTKPIRRGLKVSRGLGFFRAGIIDQHFHQYRGRLGRLVRATTERQVRFGFGIDENTALYVAPDGNLEVIGPGNVTLIDTSEAHVADGPLGCRIGNVQVSLLAHGDRWDTAKQTLTVPAGRQPVVEGRQSNFGSFLIPDISAEGAVPFALVSGLADNRQRRQQGITLKHHDTLAHGFRFTFQKTKATRAYGGYVDGVYSHTVERVRLDIEPIDGSLRAPQSALPRDLLEFPNGLGRTAVVSLWFRGVLPMEDAGQARPDAAVTRGEFARMLARGVHLLPPLDDPPSLSDISVESSLVDEVSRVVAAQLMTVDSDDAFHPQSPLTRLHAAISLHRLAQQLEYEWTGLGTAPVPDLDTISTADRPAMQAAVQAGWLPPIDGRLNPMEACTRLQASLALYQILGFRW